MVGNVIIAVLATAVLVLLAACALLWTQAHDAKLQAHVRARIQILKAEEEATEAKHEAAMLRKQIIKLKASCERGACGKTNAPD